MATRKIRNPELNMAVDSLNDAARHVRTAVQGKIDELRSAATAELAKAKAEALKKTLATQNKVESALNKAEARLHKVIAKAEKSLDKAMREAEKRSAAPAPLPSKKAARKSAAR